MACVTTTLRTPARRASRTIMRHSSAEECPVSSVSPCFAASAIASLTSGRSAPFFDTATNGRSCLEYRTWFSASKVGIHTTRPSPPFMSTMRSMAAGFTPLFACKSRGAHRIHFHLENALHRLLDLGLGCLQGNFEDQGRFGFLYTQTLFRNNRAAQDLICRFHYATSACLRLGAAAFREFCNFSSAGRAKIVVS